MDKAIKYHREHNPRPGALTTFDYKASLVLYLKQNPDTIYREYKKSLSNPASSVLEQPDASLLNRIPTTLQQQTLVHGPGMWM